MVNDDCIVTFEYTDQVFKVGVLVGLESFDVAEGVCEVFSHLLEYPIGCLEFCIFYLLNFLVPRYFEAQPGQFFKIQESDIVH